MQASIFDTVINQNITIEQANRQIYNAITECKKLTNTKPLPYNITAKIREFSHIGESKLIIANSAQAIRVPLGKLGLTANINKTNKDKVFNVTLTNINS